ncbi:MAG TPA: hypothetical protein VNJ70_09080 [Thermoanaerobaculia bacterium]|nr:hypothetical protein [Thermoanaerobaculia bacterium]
MPIELGVWRIDHDLAEVTFEPMTDESRLESILHTKISIAAPHLMVIGRQVRTAFDKLIDLLAMDVAGNLAVLELKRDKTYRDIVAQVLDYGSWVRSLRDDDIARIYNEYLSKWHPERQKSSLNEAFCAHFRVGAMPDELNGDHELIIVASSLDPSTERIVNYLADYYDVTINAVFFRFFADGDREYLSRVWLRDPTTADIDGGEDTPRGEWNGEYYVSFGIGETRDWQEAVKYGFISAGGGAWFTNTLLKLERGARVWANVPGSGYVGVGIVTDGRRPVEEFLVRNEAGEQIPITQLPLKIARATRSSEDPEHAEYLVPVNWIKTVSLAQAIKERGFFGNQNTVARPTTPKWDHTVERLKARFNIEEREGAARGL